MRVGRIFKPSILNFNPRVAQIASSGVVGKLNFAKALQVELREQRQQLFPIRLVSIDRIRDWSCFDADTGKDLAVELREDHIPDFSNWKNHDAFEATFADLLRDLRALA